MEPLTCCADCSRPPPLRSGVADDILPDTQLRFAFRNSACNARTATSSALQLLGSVFQRQGVRAILGAECNAASEPAANLASASLVPIISGSATASTLTGNGRYPYFSRTVPSTSSAAFPMVDVLRNLFLYTSVALAQSNDDYGLGGADSFAYAAGNQGLAIRVRVTFNPSDANTAVGKGDGVQNTFRSAQDAISSAGARVIVLYCQANVAGSFVREAYQAGVGGAGYLWLGSDAISGTSRWWLADAQLAADDALRLAALKGFFGFRLSLDVSAASYLAFIRRRHAMPPTTADPVTGACNLETDDDGTHLWARTVVGANGAATLECNGFDAATLAETEQRDAYGYDATYALAHAVHYLVTVQNKTSLVPSELLSALRAVSFEGASGAISFSYAGDRQAGVVYYLDNYRNNVEEAVAVGSWTSCVQAGDSYSYEGATSFECAWEDRWLTIGGHPTHGPSLVYSTADNSQPTQTTSGTCLAGEVILPSGNCTCASGYHLSGTGSCRRCESGTYKASPGSDQCTPCPPGSHSADRGASQCTLCPVGHYQPYSRSVECLVCASPTSAKPGSAECDVCASGNYRASFAEPPSSTNCVACPKSATCYLNTSLDTLYVKPG